MWTKFKLKMRTNSSSQLDNTSSGGSKFGFKLIHDRMNK